MRENPNSRAMVVQCTQALGRTLTLLSPRRRGKTASLHGGPDKLRSRPIRLWIACLAIVLLLFSGCRDGSTNRIANAMSEAPTLVLIDSVTLVENDSAYVAEPGDLAITPNGTFLIADRFAKRVHQFGRDGRFLGKFGRSGPGPGEFEMPGYLALDGDSLLYAADVPGIEIFDLRSYAHLGSFRTPRMPGALATSGGQLFAGYADPVQLGSIAQLTADSSKLRVTGPFPELLRNEALFPMFYPVVLALKGDTAATAYNVTNDVYLTSMAGDVLDSIAVPARRRHGVDPAVLRRFAKNVTDQKLGEAAVYGTSLPIDLHWLSGERIALVSGDWKVVDNRFVTTNYLSVVDPRTRQSCVDALIPGPIDPPVRVALRGDTLFALAQETDGGTKLVTTIRVYRIDTDDCRWVAQ